MTEQAIVTTFTATNKECKETLIDLIVDLGKLLVLDTGKNLKLPLE